MMRWMTLLIGCVLVSGCNYKKVGPQNLRCDSIAYNHAVQNSVDTQVLLNIVRLRYRDTPTFLQVGVISSAYENKYSLSSEFEFDNITREATMVSITPKIGRDHNEKPTTTYQPLRGDKFVTEFLSPISPQTLMLISASGWDIDRVLRCCAQRINGIPNAPTASGPTPESAPKYEKFLEVMKLIHELEKSDAIAIVKGIDPKTEKSGFYLVLDRDNENITTVNRFWELLDLAPGTHNIKLVPHHGKKHGKDEIVLDLRSPLSVLYFLSHGVDVPYWDEDLGKVTVTTDTMGQRFDWNEVLTGIMKIHSGPLCGRDPAVIVRYRGVTYFVDDSDLDSKSTFSLLAQLLALQTGKPNIPMLTIPLNN